MGVYDGLDGLTPDTLAVKREFPESEWRTVRAAVGQSG